MKKIRIITLIILLLIVGITYAQDTYTETWQLVTDASTLVKGNQLVIACNTHGTTAGSFQTNYLTAQASTFSDDYSTITTLGENTLIFTLGVDGDYWTLTNNGQKLGASSTDNAPALKWDNLQTKWEISIQDNNATIRSPFSYCGFICYNSTSNHFKNYQIQQTAPVQLYRLTSNAPTHNVTITSSVEDACTLPEPIAVQEGTNGEISITPHAGYIFTGWTVTKGATNDAITEVYNPETTILMGKEDITLTANFIQDEYLLVEDENFPQAGDIVLLANVYDHAVANDITSSYRLKTQTAYFAEDHSRITALTTYTSLILGGDIDAWTFAKDENDYLTVTSSNENDLKWTTTPTIYTLDINNTTNLITNFTASIIGNGRQLAHNNSSDFFIAQTIVNNPSIYLPRLYYKVTNTPRIVVAQREIKGLTYAIENNQLLSGAKEISFMNYNLTNDIIITATEGFEVSLTESGTYSRTLSAPATTTSIWVRLQKGLAEGTYTGFLTLRGGAQDRKVALNGKITAPNVAYTVTYNDNGITHALDDILYGNKITATSSLLYEDYTFVGWSTTSTIEDKNTKPILFDFTQNIQQNVDLYAVYLDSKTNTYTLHPVTSPLLTDATAFTSKSNITIPKNQTLTISVPNVVSNQLSLQPNATLKIDENASYTVEKIIVHSEGDNTPQIILPTQNSKLTCTNFYFTKRIPNDHYYFFALPFECKVADIRLSDGTQAIFGEDFIIKEYNGATRVQNQGKESNWQLIDATATLQAGKGYNIAVSTETPMELFFPLTLPNGNANLHEYQHIERTFNYIAYGKDDKSVDAIHKGWNLIGVPYFSAYNPADWGAMYLNIPDVDTDQTYSQVLANATNIAALQPFSAFFYQALTTGDLIFRANTSQKLMAKKTSTDTTQPTYIGLCLTNGSQQDETALVVHEDYTQAYEIGADLEKMLGLVDKPQIYIHDTLYRYAFKAINQQDATQANKVGVYLPAQAETTYTISLNENYDATNLQAVYLTDEVANVTVNLMQTPYTFTDDYSHTDTRFTFKSIFTSNTTTYLTQTPTTWVVYQDAPLHIQIIGLSINDHIQIIDQTGKIITHTTTHNGSYETNLPQTGIFCVRIVSKQGSQAKKIMIK